MLLSNMSYEQIHREIVKDYHDLNAAFMKELPGFRKIAKKAKLYPVRKKYHWKHPVSHNQYTYSFETKRHSDWDKDPRLVIYTQFETSEGKITVTVARDQNNNIRIQIISPHFLQRYLERNLQRCNQSTEDVLDAFIVRTSSSICMGDKVTSMNELEKDDPDLINEALLTTEGIILCKQLRRNLNIWIYKTFIGAHDLFLRQFTEVTFKALDVFYLRAMNDSPRFEKSIKKIYEDGINELNRLWLDDELDFENKQKLRCEQYQQTIIELSKYCN